MWRRAQYSNGSRADSNKRGDRGRCPDKRREGFSIGKGHLRYQPKPYGEDASFGISKTSSEEDDAFRIFPFLLHPLYCHGFRSKKHGPSFFYLSPFSL